MKQSGLKVKYHFLILALIAHALLSSCSDPKIDTIYIYNSSKDLLTVYIDDEPINTPADSTLQIKVAIGKHLLKYNDFIDTLDVTANKCILINPLKSKIIKDEVLYQSEIFRKSEAKEDNYLNPFTTIIIDSLMYGGHFLFTDDMIISHWLLNIGEPIKKSIGNTEYRKRGMGWSTDAIKGSSYKLYTPDELVTSTTPLNFDKTYIEFVVSENLLTLTSANHTFINAGYFYAGETKETVASMAEVHITNSDKIYLKKPYLYNSAEHGEILDTLYQLKNCIIEYDTNNIVRGTEIYVVKTDKSYPLRVVAK